MLVKYKEFVKALTLYFSKEYVTFSIYYGEGELE